MAKLVAVSDFSDCSVQGVLLQDSRRSKRPLPFPCYSLVSGQKEESSLYPSIHYPEVLKKIFEADTIIS